MRRKIPKPQSLLLAFDELHRVFNEDADNAAVGYCTTTNTCSNTCCAREETDARRDHESAWAYCAWLPGSVHTWSTPANGTDTMVRTEEMTQPCLIYLHLISLSPH